MPKATTQFVCSECGYTSPKWLGRCPDCGKFNTLIEEAIAPPTPAAKKTAAAFGSAKATPLRDVTYEKYERISSGIAELDVVLGGGIMENTTIFGRVNTCLRHELLPNYRMEDVRAAKLGNAAGLYGAAIQAETRAKALAAGRN